MALPASLPELRGWTPIGNLLHIVLAPEDFWQRAMVLGDMVRLRMPRGTMLLLNHPDLIEEVLVRKNRSFRKDQLTRELAQVFGNGLLVSEGEFWRRQRRMAQPAFHRDRIARYGEQMVAAATRTTATWREGQVIDLHAGMMDLAREVVATTLFSSEVGAATAVGGGARGVGGAAQAAHRGHIGPLEPSWLGSGGRSGALGLTAWGRAVAARAGARAG